MRDGIGGLGRYLGFGAERLNQNDPVDFEFSKGEIFTSFLIKWPLEENCSEVLGKLAPIGKRRGFIAARH